MNRNASGVMIAMAATVGLAAPASGLPVQQDATLTRPTAAAGPTEVRVGMYVIDIERIDNARQQYAVDFVVDLLWSDPRLAAAPGRRSINEVWHPQAILFNQRGLQTLLPEMVEVEPDGSVRYLQRYYGSLAAPLDLRDFPFDIQALPITIVSVVYGPDHVRFAFAPELSGRADPQSIDQQAHCHENHNDTHTQVGDPHLAVGSGPWLLAVRSRAGLPRVAAEQPVSDPEQRLSVGPFRRGGDRRHDPAVLAREYDARAFPGSVDPGRDDHRHRASSVLRGRTRHLLCRRQSGREDPHHRR